MRSKSENSSVLSSPSCSHPLLFHPRPSAVPFFSGGVLHISSFRFDSPQILTHHLNMSELLPPPANRGMPRWREKQRNLPLRDKVAVIGQLILETRQLEAIKKACKPSATSSRCS